MSCIYKIKPDKSHSILFLFSTLMLLKEKSLALLSTFAYLLTLKMYLNYLAGQCDGKIMTLHSGLWRFSAVFI